MNWPFFFWRIFNRAPAANANYDVAKLCICCLSLNNFRVSWSQIVVTLLKNIMCTPQIILYSAFSAFHMDEFRELGPKRSPNLWCSYSMASWRTPLIGSKIILGTAWATSWRTMVSMYGSGTSGEIDTQEAIVTWSLPKENFGIGGKFSWGNNLTHWFLELFGLFLVFRLDLGQISFNLVENALMQHDSLPFIQLACRFTTFWLGRAQKSTFWERKWPTSLGFSIF